MAKARQNDACAWARSRQCVGLKCAKSLTLTLWRQSNVLSWKPLPDFGCSCVVVVVLWEGSLSVVYGVINSRLNVFFINLLVSRCQRLFSKGHMSTDVGKAAHLCPCSLISAGKDSRLPNFLFGTCSEPQWGVYMSGGVQQSEGKWPAFGPERRSMNHSTLRVVAVLSSALPGSFYWTAVLQWTRASIPQ